VRKRTFKYEGLVRGRKSLKCRKIGVFIKSLKVEHPFLKEDQQVGKVLCSICKSQFSIWYGDRSDVMQHIKKSKRTIAADTKSCSKNGTSYFTIEAITDESKNIAAKKRTVCIPHNKIQPFLSIHGLYILNDKKIARGKFLCGRENCESMLVNVLAPFGMQQIFEELETVMVDT
jgi:hypothetical protein